MLLARNICLFLLSCTACLLGAKFVAGLTLLPLDQQTQPVAVLEFVSDKTSVNYCDSKRVVNAEFKIKNRGSKRLTINAKEFNCDCYAGNGSLVIPPGEEKLLSVPISKQALRYQPEIRFLLLTNDPDQHKVPLHITVLNQPPLAPADAVSVLQDN